MSVFARALKKMSDARPATQVKAGKGREDNRSRDKHAPFLREKMPVADESRSSTPGRNTRVVSLNHEKMEQLGILVRGGGASQVADQYRRIKRPILDNAFGQNSHVTKHSNIVMITSALPAEGKTFTSINLALSMAREKDRTVLLVDADVAKPSGISKLIGLENERGLIDLLNDESMDTDEVLYRTDVDNLSVLPSGSYDQHTTELLASERMVRVVDELASRYRDRIVIFDCPPLLVASEAQVLSSLAGQIAMIIRAGKTPQHVVKQALDLLEDDKAVNTVLNKSERGDGGGYYGRYHG